MAAEIIGTAYVRIRAITTGLAKDISDGVDKGVKDAGPDIRKSGEDIGTNLGEGSSKTFKGSFRDGVSDGIDAPEIHRDAEDGGSKIAKSVKRGVEKENKKNNPFDSLSKAFKSLDIGGPIGWAAIFGPTTIAPIIGTITAGVALLTEALGFVVTAAAGAGAALAGIAAVALPGFALLFAALKVNTKELEAFKKAAEKLVAPWKEVARATQRTLLPGLEAALKSFQHFIPLFTEFGTDIGQIGGDFAAFAAATLTSEKNMSALADILADSTGFFEHMRGAAVAFIDMLLPFLSTVTPLAVKFSESIERWAKGLSDSLAEPGKLDALTATFETWYDRFVVLVDIIGNVGSALWDTFTIAADAGTPLFDSIADLTQKWADWTNSIEGENALRTFFANAQPVLDELGRLLGNIWEIIVQPSTSDGGAAMFSNLAWALDLLNDVLEKPMIRDMAPTLLTTIVALKTLSLLAGPIAAVGTAIGILGKSFEVLGKALSVLATPLGVVMDILTGTAIGTAASVLLAVAAAAGLVYLAFQKWDEWVLPVLRVAGDLFSQLSTPLKIAVGALVGLLLVLNPVAWAVAIAGVLKNFDAIVDKLSEIGNAIKEFVGFDHLRDMIVDFAEAVPEALSGLADAFTSFFTETLPDTLSGVGPAIGNAILDGVRNLPSWILSGLGALWEVGENILGFITDGLATALPAFAEFFLSLPGRILEFLGQAVPKLLSAGIDIIGWILRGLAQAIPRILAFFISLPFEIGTLLRKGAVALMTAFADGIVQAAPRVLKWFQDLPGNLASMLSTAASWLLDVGLDIIQGIYNGITQNWQKIGEFFLSLPSTILGLLGDVGSMLLDVGGALMDGLWAGIQTVWASINEFFVGMPAALLSALGDLGTFLWNGITGGMSSFLSDIVSWGAEIITELASLPGKALTAIGDLGMTIWNAITGGFATALTNVGRWVTDAWNKLSDFARDAPGKVASFVTGLPAKIGEATTAALDKITTWVTDGWEKFSNFARDVPSKLQSLVSSIGNKIGEGLDNALDKIGQWVTDAFKKIGEFVTGLPGKLAGAASTLASGVGRALKSAWNTAVDNLPGIHWNGPFGVKIDLSASFLKFAQGGIIPGSIFGTMLVAGEGGKSEAVVPMERPQRALAVMQAAGLDRLVLNAYLSDKGLTTPALGLGGEVTLLNVEKATFVEPVDADLVVQKISSAYRRLKAS